MRRCWFRVCESLRNVVCGPKCPCQGTILYEYFVSEKQSLLNKSKVKGTNRDQKVPKEQPSINGFYVGLLAHNRGTEALGSSALVSFDPIECGNTSFLGDQVTEVSSPKQGHGWTWGTRDLYQLDQLASDNKVRAIRS